MIYYKIKGIRKFKNLTVGFLASELQIPVANYIAIENGEVDLKISKLFLIAEILGVFAYDLFYCTEMKDAENEPFNLYTVKRKDLNYIPFSDSVEELYIVKLKEENRRLNERLF
jgi:transcriptional regulator with XRE-family HTH domain